MTAKDRRVFSDTGKTNEIDEDKLYYEPDKWNVISLFSGCGGLDLGVELAGLNIATDKYVMEAAIESRVVFNSNVHNNVFNIIYANDFSDEARETYSKNAGKYVYVDNTDIRKIKKFPQADMVLGSFPCPAFLKTGDFVDDKNNFLYLHFIRCLMQSKPKIFISENTKGILTLNKGETFKQIIEDFSATGYTVYYKILNAADYGVPQIREKMIIIGVRNDLNFVYKFPEPVTPKHISLKEAIGDLESCPGDYFLDAFSSVYMSRNRKKPWNEPGFAVQASGKQCQLHPSGEPMVKVGKDKWEFRGEINRRMSVLEIARLQTFPDWYVFSRGDNLDTVYKQLGNAVPVRLALAVALPIAEYARKDLLIK